MARKSNSQLRRSEIVAALLATMAEHGYEKSTIQLIARQAGLAPGLLHYHFKSKAEILLALAGTLVERSRRRYAELAEHAKSADERLDAYIESRLAPGPGADASAVAAWVTIGAEALRQPEVREVYRQAVGGELRLAEQLLDACMAERGRAGAGVKPLAAALLALMEGAFQLASAAPEAVPAGYAAGAARDLVRHHLGARRPARARGSASV